MPRKTYHDDGTIRDSRVHEILEENKLRRIIKVLRHADMNLSVFDRDYVADTLERILAAPAKDRLKAALGGSKKGRPAKIYREADRKQTERFVTIAKRVAEYRDGKVDGNPHPLYESSKKKGAIVLVAEEYPNDLQVECERRAREQCGETNDITAVAKNKAEGVVREVWEACWRARKTDQITEGFLVQN